jgi:hypothetical protein
LIDQAHTHTYTHTHTHTHTQPPPPPFPVTCTDQFHSITFLGSTWSELCRRHRCVRTTSSPDQISPMQRHPLCAPCTACVDHQSFIIDCIFTAATNAHHGQRTPLTPSPAVVCVASPFTVFLSRCSRRCSTCSRLLATNAQERSTLEGGKHHLARSVGLNPQHCYSSRPRERGWWRSAKRSRCLPLGQPAT